MLDEHNVSLGGEVPFQVLRGTLRRIGQRTGSVQGLEANELRGGFRFLNAAIQRDLEAAAAGGGQSAKAAGLLREANRNFARAKGIDELAEAIEGAINKGRADLLENFNPARALNELAQSPNLPKSFTPQELEEIGALLRRFRGLPSLPPPGGQAAIGSGRLLSRVLIAGGLGGSAGGALGGLPGFAMGQALGIGLANAGSAAVAKLLSTDRGRRFLTRLVEAQGGVIDQRLLPTLVQAARAASFAGPSNGAEGSAR
jgi:hypothetical protein